MGPESLKAYLHEFKYTYPVAIDRHTGGNLIPDTMTKLGLRGTPSILLIDKLGRLRRHFFGQMEDLRLGTEIGLLIGEHYDPECVNRSDHKILNQHHFGISRAMRKVSQHAGFKEGLNPLQIQILQFLCHGKNRYATVGFIAAEMEITEATVSDSLKTLANRWPSEEGHLQVR